MQRGCREREDVLRVAEPAQPVWAEIDQAEPFGQPAFDEAGRRARQEHLTAVGECPHAGRTRRSRTEAVAASATRLAGVEADPRADREAFGPRFLGDPFDDLGCGAHGSRGSGEDGDRGVSFPHRLKEAAAASLDDLSDERVVADDRGAHGMRMRFPERRRAFQVGHAHA